MAETDAAIPRAARRFGRDLHRRQPAGQVRDPRRRAGVAGGNSGEAELLAGAYRRSLELAVEHNCASVALPAISTGVYGYPVDLASRVTLSTCGNFLAEHDGPKQVHIVLFSAGILGAFAAAPGRIDGGREVLAGPSKRRPPPDGRCMKSARPLSFDILAGSWPGPDRRKLRSLARR